ncbi:MAG: hypothetical protein LBP95_05425 [Deltaproteobacteria bacterium]|nr:hypothetical protein [Deltaproteobacteria bacterium]
MLRMKFTKHFNGVTAIGTRSEMQETVWAYHDVCDFDDGDNGAADTGYYLKMAERTLVPCYDMRHSRPRIKFGSDKEDEADFISYINPDLDDDDTPDNFTRGVVDVGRYDWDDDDNDKEDEEDISNNEIEEDDDGNWSVKVGGQKRPIILEDLDMKNQNSIYWCNTLYPEMCYSMMTLNHFIRKRVRKLTESNNLLDQRVAWDRSIAMVRSFQTAFARCVSGHLSPANFNKWIAMMNDPPAPIETMLRIYLDVLCGDFIGKTDALRRKSLIRSLSALVSFSSSVKYRNVKAKSERLAKRYKVDIQLIEYNPKDVTFYFKQNDERW